MTVGKKSLFKPADTLDGSYLPSSREYRSLVDDCNSGKLLARPDLKRSGRRRAQPLREPDRPISQDYTVTKSSDPAVKAAELKSILADPVKAAAFMADARRPSGVSKERHGLALRIATGQPILNAQPRMVKDALESNALPTITAGGFDSTLIVKPLTGAAAKAGRSSSFWGERAWKIMVPKYGRGFFIRYDTGGDSRVYPSRSELVSAIRRSGFQVIKR